MKSEIKTFNNMITHFFLFMIIIEHVRAACDVG